MTVLGEQDAQILAVSVGVADRNVQDGKAQERGKLRSGNRRETGQKLGSIAQRRAAVSFIFASSSIGVLVEAEGLAQVFLVVTERCA